jgi:hypothetical protein
MTAFPPVDQRQEQSSRPGVVTHRHHPRLAGWAVKPAQAGDKHSRVTAAVGMVPPHEVTAADRLVLTHPRAIQPLTRSRPQPTWRCTFSAFDGPGSVAAIHGPGIDGSMMPSSSQV